MVVAEPGPMALKEKGNEYFKAGDYETALQMYSDGIDRLGEKSSPDMAVMFKNRAACLLKLDQHEGVISDINSCISLGGGDSKAYYRRAVAHQHLKQLDKALKDAMDAVRIDPRNKAAVDLVMAIRRDIQGRKDLMTSTTGLVDEMLGSLRDQAAPMDKKTQAMKNLVTITSNKAGSETVMRKEGLKDIIQYLHKDETQLHALNCIMCLSRDSQARTAQILEAVPLSSSLRILKQKNESSLIIGGVLYEMLSSTLEDRGFDYTKRVLGESIKKFPVPKLLKTLFEYFKKCCKVAGAGSMNTLLNAVVKVTDSRVLNEQLLEGGLVNSMVTMVMDGRVTYEHSQQISIIISKVWTRARISDKKTLDFVKQTSSLINPRLLSGEEEHQMLALRALNILLQGSFEAGGDVIRDTSEVYRVVSKLLCSPRLVSQQTAAESVALMSSDKKMCYNLAGQNFALLKTLYKRPEVDDAVKLRALVGMSKMCASSGGDVNQNITAEGAGGRLFKQIRQLLVKNPTEETRKWAIEALAYLSIDAEVKHDLAFDGEVMKIICNLCEDIPNPSTSYSLGCIFMNMTNSYETPDIAPEMVRIAEYAKQSVPQAHELDSEENLKNRISELVKQGVPTVLSACASADSERTREFIARCLFALVSNNEGAHCGSVVQLGGTRSLLNLFQDNSVEGKKYAAHAIAKIAIKMNPALAFSGQRSLDACRPCISLIESTNENTFLVYDGLMALTNLASVSDSVRDRILREGGCHHIEFQQLEDNEALRRAATQTLCNMALSGKFRERYHPVSEPDTPDSDIIYEPVDRLKAIFVFCGDEDYHTRVAALGAVAYLSQETKICRCLIKIASFEEVMQETICVEDPGIRHRMLVILQNMISSEKEVADKIINTQLFECLLALMQVPGQSAPMMQLLENCMSASRHWGLIQDNPGDYVYTNPDNTT